MLDLEPIKANLARFGEFINKGETWEGDGSGGVCIDLGGKGTAFITQWIDRGEPDHATLQDRLNAAYLTTLHNAVLPQLIAEVERLRADLEARPANT